MSTKSKQSPKFKVGDIVYTCSPINGVVEKRGITSIEVCSGLFFCHFSDDFLDYAIESLCFKTQQEAAKHRIEFFQNNIDYWETSIKLFKEKIEDSKKNIVNLQKVVDNPQ